MTKPSVLILSAMAIIPSLTMSNVHAAGLDDAGAHARAASLRAQPLHTSDPAWFVERADNSTLSISVLAQARYTASGRASTDFVPADNRETIGFSIPRTRVSMDGTIVSSQFNYRLSFDFGDAELSRGRGSGTLSPGSTGAPRMLDAYMQYNFEGRREGYYLKAGQFGHVIVNEEAIDSAFQLAIDRSLTAELFGAGYTQGVALGRVRNNYAWEVSISDGGKYFGAPAPDNSAINDSNEADIALGGRFDWKLFGSWDQFTDFTSFRGSNPGAKIGFGVLYQLQGYTNPDEFTPPFLVAAVKQSQVVTWTVDYQYEGDGWNFMAAYIGQYVGWTFDEGSLKTQHNALVAQAGWFISERVEWYGRLESFWIDKQYRNGFGLDNGYIHRFATVGVNYYMLPESHTAKLSADVSYALDDTSLLGVGADTLGLPDPATGFQGLTEGEYVFRLQLQLLF
ncbi:MAG: hypothetical protein WD114_05465 [Phycisphaerales bacterium]